MAFVVAFGLGPDGAPAEPDRRVVSAAGDTIRRLVAAVTRAGDASNSRPENQVRIGEQQPHEEHRGRDQGNIGKQAMYRHGARLSPPPCAATGFAG